MPAISPPPDYEAINRLLINLLQRFAVYVAYPGIDATDALTKAMDRYEAEKLREQ